MNSQQLERNNDIKQIELNDIKHVLDEKLRENSSLKKEKMYFIEKLAEFEREKHEYQSIIQTSSKQSIHNQDISSILTSKTVHDQHVRSKT